MKYHCEDKMILQLSFHYNGVCYMKYSIKAKSQKHWRFSFHYPLDSLIMFSKKKNHQSSALLAFSQMVPTWGPPGSCRPQMDPMNLAIWAVTMDSLHKVPVMWKKFLCYDIIMSA